MSNMGLDSDVMALYSELSEEGRTALVRYMRFLVAEEQAEKVFSGLVNSSPMVAERAPKANLYLISSNKL